METTTEKKHMFVLSYQGNKGYFIINSMKQRFRNLLPKRIAPTVVSIYCKFKSQFPVRHKIKVNCKHDVIYLDNCRESDGSDNYVGETTRRISEQILNHTGKDA